MAWKGPVGLTPMAMPDRFGRLSRVPLVKIVPVAGIWSGH